MNKIRNIVIWNSKFIEENLVEYAYGLNKDEHSNMCEKRVDFRLPVSLEKRLNDEKSFAIVESGNTEFVNGFKLVKNEYGQSLYVREEDNKLLPYVFDIATDFNKFGLAMVAIDTRVSWINKNFQYINKDGEICDYDNIMEDGWVSVFDFSDRQNPLSKLLYIGGYHGSFVSYMNSNMELQHFYEFGEENIAGDDGEYIFDRNSSEFSKDGFSIAKDKVLSDQGYYIDGDVIIKEAMNKGLVKSLFENNKN